MEKRGPGLREQLRKEFDEKVYSGNLKLSDIQKALEEAYKNIPKQRIIKVTPVNTKPQIPDFPTLEEVQASEWCQTRPKVIQLAIANYPPTQLYRFKASQKQFYIVSYSAPGDLPEDRWEEVTITVNKTGVGGPMDSMGLGLLDTNSVFGVPLNTIESVNNTNNVESI